MKRQSIEKEVAQRLLCNTVEPGNRKKDGGEVKIEGKIGCQGGKSPPRGRVPVHTEEIPRCEEKIISQEGSSKMKIQDCVTANLLVE